jgi:hypothetical protein
VKTPLPVAASIAQRPGYGGHAWAFLQFLLGFEELGYQPVLIDRLSAEMVTDESGTPSPTELHKATSWFRDVAASVGLSESCALLLDDGDTIGIDRDRLEEMIAAAPFLLDVMGFLGESELLEAAQMSVFLDVDPGFTQIWRHQGEANLFGHHDRHVTVGANVGSPQCSIPTCGCDWIPIRPPVALSRWSASPPTGGAFRSVASWRGPYDPVWFGDRRLGLRVHEFRRFAAVPAQVNAPFELALDIDPADEADSRLLRENGWTLLNPCHVAGSLASYADFVRNAGAEISIAKNIYVDTRSGWFSDRSACFLAAGRPVLAQDTGWGAELAGSDGLIAFTTPEEAVEGARRIQADSAVHSEAARALAEDVFDSRKVLDGLLAQLGAR